MGVGVVLGLALGLGLVLGSKLGLRIVLGCKVDKISFRRLWCPWSVRRLRLPWTPEASKFGYWLLARGPLRGGGGGVGTPGLAEPPPPPPGYAPSNLLGSAQHWHIPSFEAPQLHHGL